MNMEEQAWMEAREAWLADTTSPKYTSPYAWVSGYAAALIAKRSKDRPWIHEIIAAAVEALELGPEDQDAVLRFGMRLQDMEDAERKAQPLTVEQIAQTVWWWAIDAKMVNATTEPYHLNIDLRDRLTTLLNTSAAMADIERCQQLAKDVDLDELERITDENRSFGE